MVTRAISPIVLKRQSILFIEYKLQYKQFSYKMEYGVIEQTNY